MTSQTPPTEPPNQCDATGEQIPIGATVYIAAMMMNAQQEFQGLEVMRGKLISSKASDGYDVEIVAPVGPQVLRFPRGNVYTKQADAEKRLLAFQLQHRRERLLKAVGGNRQFYPDVLLPFEGVIMSGNPLRAGEAGMGFSAQTNAWGEEQNPQKLLMIAGSIWDDLHVLMGVLETLAYANDYAKKLVGKFLILELQNLYLCLIKLKKVDGAYAPLFVQLESDISGLEDQLKFKVIRDKVAAHRDADLDVVTMTSHWRRITRYNVNKYLALFIDHLAEVRKHYPHEFVSYFFPPKVMPGLVAGPVDEADYEPFDPPWKERGTPDDSRDAS